MDHCDAAARDQGNAAGEGFKGGAAGGEVVSGDDSSSDDVVIDYDGPLDDEPEEEELEEIEA